jgi:Tol biopolymer transport system component
MLLRFRKIAALSASLLAFTASRLTAQEKQDSQQPHETTGTRKDVEKRLKAQEKPKPATSLEAVTKTLNAAHHFAQTAISPDGAKVAWVVILTGKDGAESNNKAIYLKSLNGNAPPQRITAGDPGSAHAEGDVAWSPDSKRLAFLSDALKKDQPQLYVANVLGSPEQLLHGSLSVTVTHGPKRYTDVKGFLDLPRWSPDGKTIAVLFTQNASREAGPLVAETPETGEIKDAFVEQRLALVDVATGKLRQISPAETYVYEYDWSPDGTRFALTAALGNGDNNWYIAELYVLDAATGLMKSIY